jgi:DNA-directed RNA polymerase specialized sigma24 family protein
MNDFSHKNCESAKTDSDPNAALQSAFELILDSLNYPTVYCHDKVDQAYELLNGKMVRYAGFLLCLKGADPAQSEDVVGDFWVALLTLVKLGVQRDPVRMPFPLPYVFGILRHLTLETGRKFKTCRTRMKPLGSYEPLDETNNPAEFAEHQELIDALHCAIDELEPYYAEAVAVRYFSAFPRKDLSPNNLYLRTHRAKSLLYDTLSPSFGIEDL